MAHPNPSQHVDALLASLASNPITSDSELSDLENKLQQAISASHRLRLAPKSRQNSMLPINKLPPETLATIFGMAQPQIASVRPMLRYQYKDWFNFSHVCRYWRETALLSPSLWCRIDIHGIGRKTLKSYRKAAPTFLERCCCIPLTIYYSPHAINDDLESRLFSQTARFKEFHILAADAWGSFVQHRMWHWCKSSAPILEALTISFTPSDSRLDSVLPELFSRVTPMLKRLTLCHFSTWSRNQFKNLTHISLHSQPVINRVTLDEFLDFLRLSPLIEELVLENAGPNPDTIIPNDGHSVEPVSLDRLQNIKIGGWESFETVVLFLSYLLIPNTTRILAWGKWNMKPTVDNILPSSQPFVSKQTNHLIETLLISITPSERHVLSIAPPVLTMSGSHHLEVLSTQSFANVQELYLLVGHKPLDYSITTYRKMFQSLPSLKVLALSSRLVCFPVFFALGIDPNDPPLCPKLDTIRVNSNRETSLLILSLYAQQRAKNGVPIKHLYVADGADEGYVVRLRSVIEDVQLQTRSIPARDIHVGAGVWTPESSNYLQLAQ